MATRQISEGAQINSWTVIRRTILGTKARWLCRCQCGTEREVYQGHLARGASKSCGCSRRRALKHGASMGRLQGKALSSEYQSWRAMRARCSDPHYHAWKHYGGKGIVVCERWNDFSTFLGDMGPKPTPKHTIERIDSNGDYEPANCRWATAKEQCRNTSRNRFITFQGQTLTVVEWSERLGTSHAAINTRLHKGWPEELALTWPLRKRMGLKARFKELSE